MYVPLWSVNNDVQARDPPEIKSDTNYRWVYGEKTKRAVFPALHKINLGLESGNTNNLVALVSDLYLLH